MTTATATTLADIPRESIERIDWVSLRGRAYKLTSRQQIDYWLAHFGWVPVEFFGNRWRTVESTVPYRFFEVFVK